MERWRGCLDRRTRIPVPARQRRGRPPWLGEVRPRRSRAHRPRCAPGPVFVHGQRDDGVTFLRCSPSSLACCRALLERLTSTPWRLSPPRRLAPLGVPGAACDTCRFTGPSEAQVLVCAAKHSGRRPARGGDDHGWGHLRQQISAETAQS